MMDLFFKIGLTLSITWMVTMFISASDFKPKVKFIFLIISGIQLFVILSVIILAIWLKDASQ